MQYVFNQHQFPLNKTSRTGGGNQCLFISLTDEREYLANVQRISASNCKNNRLFRDAVTFIVFPLQEISCTQRASVIQFEAFNRIQAHSIKNSILLPHRIMEKNSRLKSTVALTHQKLIPLRTLKNVSNFGCCIFYHI